MTINPLIGRNITRYRTALGITKQNMALDMGISSSYLHYLEKGEKNPTADKLQSIADYLGIPVIALFEEDRPRDIFPHTVYSDDAKFFYQPEREFCVHPIIGTYIGWGIKAYVYTDEQWSVAGVLHDIATDREQVAGMAERLNRNQVQPVHLMDVVEDLLAV